MTATQITTGTNRGYRVRMTLAALVTTDAQGNAFSTFTLVRPVGADQNITATARNASTISGSTADTSEFSAPATVQDLTHPRVKTTVPVPNATGVSPTARQVTRSTRTRAWLVIRQRSGSSR